jgi:hypothetical protein
MPLELRQRMPDNSRDALITEPCTVDISIIDKLERPVLVGQRLERSLSHWCC